MTDFLIRLFVKDQTDIRKLHTAYGTLAGCVGILLNLLLCGSKFLIGALCQSIAIQADAINNLSDVGSSVVTLVGFRAAGKPADAQHPFGHGRIEYVAGLAISFLILLVGVEIGKEAIGRILSPSAVNFRWASVAVLFGSICVKLWMGRFTSRIGRKIHSQALAAATTDSISDVVATSAVLLSTLASHFFHLALDGYMGVLAALFVLYSGIGILKDTMSPLMGEAPSPQLVQELKARLLSYEGILGIHDLIIHEYGAGQILATVHAEVSALEDILEIHETIDKAEREIGAAMGLHLTIHMDPLPVNDQARDLAASQVAQVIASIDPRLSFHDFRMVPSDNCITLIFDLVTPYGQSGEWTAEIKKRIKEGMQSFDCRYRCAITVDSDYLGG